MPRILRLVIPGRPHHVTQRGNHRQKVFFSNKDYETYMNLMRKFFRKYGVDSLGYCLMPNHVHHAGIPALENSLAKGVGLLHNDFARWQQIQRNQTGHLWQGRFYSNPMDDNYCWAALRYIELNPVRAGLVLNAWDWPWSSARAHTTGTDETGMLNMELWGKYFDKIRWREFLLEGLGKADEIDRIRVANRTGRPLGSDDFIQHLEKITGRSLFPKKRGPKPSLGKKMSQ
ncbi:MAG TPA: transposase [Acidobacteriota bacterium]|nr:transposase [Acidobacteriota bacterium]